MAGTQNIKDPITSPDRPDLILHNSMGFEAGGQHKLQQVVEFLAEKCKAPDIQDRLDVISLAQDRLHVIWLAHDIHPVLVIMNADKVAGFVPTSAIYARNKKL